MSENDGVVSPSGETVQKSKLPVLLIILEIVGIVLALPYTLYNIPAIRDFYEEVLKLGDGILTLRVVIMALLILIIVIAALLESSLKKKNLLSKSVGKASTILNLIVTILVIANLVLYFVFK